MDKETIDLITKDVEVNWDTINMYLPKKELIQRWFDSIDWDSVDYDSIETNVS